MLLPHVHFNDLKNLLVIHINILFLLIPLKLDKHNTFVLGHVICSPHQNIIYNL